MSNYRLTPAVHPLVHRVCETYRPRYAIVNSIEFARGVDPVRPSRRGDSSPRPRVRRLHPAAGPFARGDPEGHRGRLLRAARLGQRRAPVPVSGIAARAYRAAGPGPSPENPIRRRRVRGTRADQERTPARDCDARDGGRDRRWLGPDPQGRGPVHCSGRGGPARGVSHALSLCMGGRRLRSRQRPCLLDLFGRADAEVRAGRELCHSGRGLAPGPRVR